MSAATIAIFCCISATIGLLVAALLQNSDTGEEEDEPRTPPPSR